MKEKFILASKLKERILIKNFSLNSFKKLPWEIYQKLPQLLNNFLLLYGNEIYKPEVKILSDSRMVIKRGEKLPPFSVGEILLLILPFSDKRFIFQSKVIEEKEEGYDLEILDPRTYERININKQIPVFLYFISPKYVQELIQKEEYQLFRESNFSLEDSSLLEEIHLYDLVLNANHNIDETFKKLIKRPLLVSNLVNISRAGLATQAFGQINLEDEFNLFYLNFTIPYSNKNIKLGLFSHLRNLS
ncbi:MAG: hypothetical protein ACK4GE_04900, partial [Caldimicrobium sp.]